MYEKGYFFPLILLSPLIRSTILLSHDQQQIKIVLHMSYYFPSLDKQSRPCLCNQMYDMGKQINSGAISHERNSANILGFPPLHARICDHSNDVLGRGLQGQMKEVVLLHLFIIFGVKDLFVNPLFLLHILQASSTCVLSTFCVIEPIL